ncbi:recombinase family protein [Patescibacteria group bacterium]
MNQLSGKRAIILARISTPKQAITGDSLEDQIFQCRKHIDINDMVLVKVFTLVESGTKEERKFFDEVLEYCTNKRNKIEVAVFKNIGRLSRAGAYGETYSYKPIKDKLAKSGIILVDIAGLIQGPVNALEHAGFSYTWSVYSPSETAEMIEANRYKDEARNILTRMIGAEIRYAPLGYLVRSPEFGYTSKKINTDNGLRSIRVPDPNESVWVKKIFDMRAKGTYTDEEIVSTLNKLGFKTRKQNLHDPRTKKIVGSRGMKPLTIKYMRRLLENVIYTGVIKEKWTKGVPIKSEMVEPLVTITTFNKANRGKVSIGLDSNNKVNISRNKNETVKRSFNKNNPEFPYKNYVLCPFCRKPFLGSKSRGKSGKHFPAYHCSRGHKYYGVNKKEFEKTVIEFIDSLRFKKEFIDKVKEAVVEVWQREKEQRLDESILAERELLKLKEEKVNLLNKIKVVESDLVRKELESEYTIILDKIELTKSLRNREEIAEKDLEQLIQKMPYLMEHPKELLLDTPYSISTGEMFSRFFSELPTYEELKNGTPKLTPIYELSRNQNMSKDDLVTLRGIEPRLPG